MNDYIHIKGARVNNLKNIDLDIPRNKLIVITGLSGSTRSTPKDSDATWKACRLTPGNFSDE